MGLLSIVLTTAFSVILCFVEIPKMWKSKEYKELAVFSFLLCFGVVIAVLKSFDIDIPNPADFVEAVYSPIVTLIKGALE